MTTAYFLHTTNRKAHTCSSLSGSNGMPSLNHATVGLGWPVMVALRVTGFPSTTCWSVSSSENLGATTTGCSGAGGGGGSSGAAEEVVQKFFTSLISRTELYGLNLVWYKLLINLSEDISRLSSMKLHMSPVGTTLSLIIFYDGVSWQITLKTLSCKILCLELDRI